MSAFASSTPSQRCRMWNCTPAALSRCSQARSSGAAFMSLGKTRPEVPTKVSTPSPCAHSRNCCGPSAASQGSTCARRSPKRDAKGSAASEWVRFRPPRPASRNLRPTDGMASNRCTCAPAADRVSAAIRPAGPPPMTAMSARREFIGALLLALLQWVQQGSGYGRHSFGRHANTWFLSQ